MPKLYFVDTGLACHLLGLKSPEQLLSSHFYGGFLESFVIMECYKHLAWAVEETGIYHFRDKQKNEVDIVLEQDNGRIIGIEVKAAASVNILMQLKLVLSLAEGLSWLLVNRKKSIARVISIIFPKMKNIQEKFMLDMQILSYIIYISFSLHILLPFVIIRLTAYLIF